MEVLQLDHLAKQLRAKRFKGGSIGFDRPEVRFEIDEKGTPNFHLCEDSQGCQQTRGGIYAPRQPHCG